MYIDVQRGGYLAVVAPIFAWLHLKDKMELKQLL